MEKGLKSEAENRKEESRTTSSLVEKSECKSRIGESMVEKEVMAASKGESEMQEKGTTDRKPMSKWRRVCISGKIRFANGMETLKRNDGIGTIEIILILVVLIALIVIFRKELTTIIENIFNRITDDAAAV